MADHSIVSRLKIQSFLTGLGHVPSARLKYKRRKDRDYIQDLADLGLNEDAGKQVVYSLTLENYSYGPEDEHKYHENDVWFFGYDVAGVEAYIKLRITTNLPNQDPRGLILPFHKADFLIDYPYNIEANRNE